MDETYVLLIIGAVILMVTTCYIFLIYRVSQDYSDYKACVINLVRRRDRLLDFRKHYTLAIDFDIVDAVDGKALDEELLVKNGILGSEGYQSIINSKQNIKKRYHYELGTIGAVGCSLSHVNVWKRMVDENINYMLVFEDDAWVMNVTMDEIVNRLTDLPEDWHMYMIGQPHSILEGIPVLGKKNLYKVTRFCGTHAYLINKKGAEWLLKNGRLFPIQQQIDAHLSELCWEHGFNVYIHLNVPLIGAFDKHSDIQVASDKATWERYRL